MNRQIGYWVIVTTMTLCVAIAAWFYGSNSYPSPLVRVLVVLLAGTWLLLLSAPLAKTWQWIARYDGNRVRNVRDPKARLGNRTNQGPNPGRKSQLKYVLRTEHDRRWRYARPWMLLIGSDDVIKHLLPDVAERGYSLFGDALWLWHATDNNGLIDRHWLEQLYKLRRRRPLDGIVLVFDSAAALHAERLAMPHYGQVLAQIAQTLRWSAPIYALEVDNHDGSATHDLRLIGWENTGAANQAETEIALLALRDQLAHDGVFQLGTERNDAREARLSKRLDQRSSVFAKWITRLGAHGFAVRGLFFSSVPAGTKEDAKPTLSSALLHIARRAGRDGGRPLHSHPRVVSAFVGFALLGLCAAGMLASTFVQVRELHQVRTVVRQLDTAHDEATQLRALLSLQQRIAVYEARMQRPETWLVPVGRNQDHAVLDALWMRYARASRTLLTTPVQLSLESALQAMARKRADALQDQATQRAGYDTLKAYQMLATPDRTDAAFLAEQIVKAWPMPLTLSQGEWQDTSQRLAAFYADHLRAHPDWRITPSAHRIAAARNALIQQIGLASTDERIYQAMLAELRDKYADVPLSALLLGTDAEGLFATAQTVPGIYTRAAWEGSVGKAIDQAAAAQRERHDWVLADASADTAVAAHSADTLKARLTERYFADYAAAWQRMLNSIRWQPARQLNEAIDQLTRLTDAQTSPLTALMNAIRQEAQVGRSEKTLGDALVHRARSLIGQDEAANAASALPGPVEASFAPLLALLGESADSTVATGTHHRSLQGFLTTATTLRLTLQKIAGSPDAQAMAAAFARAVFQGQLSELTQAREDASLTAAGLGSAWAGFAQALFAQPVESAWRTLLQPAAASLNDVWRDTLATPFNRAFAGRYPFFDSQADASLAELGRFIRPETGLLTRFLTTQLSGVLSAQGDQWVLHGLASSSLALDPAFLEAIRQLTALGAHMYVQGEAGYRFELMALPTPQVTRSALHIDRQQIVYFNQREGWTPITWPGDGLAGHATLSWDTIDSGTRRPFDFSGDWAFLRALEQADVQPLDGARYQLTWTQPDKESLRYVLRTQLGEGPLELLKLRGFRLPERIFQIDGQATSRDVPASMPRSLSSSSLSP